MVVAVEYTDRISVKGLESPSLPSVLDMTLTIW